MSYKSQYVGIVKLEMVEVLANDARPLDFARFQYHFENGSKQNVMNVLSYYQNEEGGYGHAM